MNQTSHQYDSVIASCRDLFIKKNKDYGTSWRVMRNSSIMDQIFIKAQRIRTIEEKKSQKINDSTESEFVGIINYCLIALIQMELNDQVGLNPDIQMLTTMYDKQIALTKELMMQKNHDYGEAWRDMRVSTFTDMLLMRLLRIRQIEESDGKTLASEGVESNIRDMINYSVFALIQLSEQQKSTTV
ncbi:MAG: DUF1599 domain-containing protein [Bacteroidota bacterium]